MKKTKSEPVRAKRGVIKAPTKSTPKHQSQGAESIVKQPKDKRIRGTFSMPVGDHALIGELKSRLKQQGRRVKKNDLLRAGLRALKLMNDDALQSSLSALNPSNARLGKKTK